MLGQAGWDKLYPSAAALKADIQCYKNIRAVLQAGSWWKRQHALLVAGDASEYTYAAYTPGGEFAYPMSLIDGGGTSIDVQQPVFQHSQGDPLQQKFEPTQNAVDCCPWAQLWQPTVLGHSQEWADSRPGHGIRRPWLCPLCGHSWQAMVFGKVRILSGAQSAQKCSKHTQLTDNQA
ncbi:TPA: hypothetical protein ACH3X1_001600 [Trebouxia sp. C0004]